MIPAIYVITLHNQQRHHYAQQFAQVRKLDKHVQKAAPDHTK
jgi:hypothetical protein